MKIRELMEAVELQELLNLPKPNQQQQQQRKTLIVQPEAVKRQQTVNKLVNRFAASAAQRAPTGEDVAIAMMKYAEIKQQSEDNLKAK